MLSMPLFDRGIRTSNDPLTGDIVEGYVTVVVLEVVDAPGGVGRGVEVFVAVAARGEAAGVDAGIAFGVRCEFPTAYS